MPGVTQGVGSQFRGYGCMLEVSWGAQLVWHYVFKRTGGRPL